VIAFIKIFSLDKKNAYTSSAGVYMVAVILFCTTCIEAGENLSSKINDEISRQFAKSANITFTMRNNTTKKLVLIINSLKNSIPASTQKVITTWTALDVLGPQQTWMTEFKYTGKIQNGVLKGDLVIVGGG